MKIMIWLSTTLNFSLTSPQTTSKFPANFWHSISINWGEANCYETQNSYGKVSIKCCLFFHSTSFHHDDKFTSFSPDAHSGLIKLQILPEKVSQFETINSSVQRETTWNFVIYFDENRTEMWQEEFYSNPQAGQTNKSNP